MNENAFANIFDKIEKAAAENIRANEGDYVLDGLLYCGKCHTPKQTRVEFLGVERTPMCLCKCAAEKRDAEEAERKRREMAIYIDKLRYKAFAEEKMHGWTFDNDDGANPKISGIAKRYVENFDAMLKGGKGLLLFGNTGTGKTYTAACIANALIDKGISCFVTNFEKIGNTLQGMYEGKQAYLDSLNRVSLLVLDDLGVERKSEYMQGIVYNVVDARCNAGLPLIVTTNLTSEELKNAADITCRRIYSRLFECCIPIEVKGTDRRREKLKKDFADYDDLLGLSRDDTQPNK